MPVAMPLGQSPRDGRLRAFAILLAMIIGRVGSMRSHSREWHDLYRCVALYLLATIVAVNVSVDSIVATQLRVKSSRRPFFSFEQARSAIPHDVPKAVGSALEELFTEDTSRRGQERLVLMGASAAPAVTYLADVVSREDVWRSMMMRARRRTPGIAARNTIIQLDSIALPGLVEALSADRPGVRAAAAWLLGQIKGNDAESHLIDALSDEDALVRSRAATAIAELGMKGSSQYLILLLQDPEPMPRQAAAFALGKLREGRASSQLILMLQNNDVGDKRIAARALGDIGAHAAVPLLVDSLGINDEQLQLASLAALEKIGSPQATPLLEPWLLDEGFEYRATVAHVMAAIGDPRATRPLCRALSSSDTTLVRKAAWALGEIGSRDSVMPLVEVIKNSEPYTRRAAAKSLGKIRDARAVPVLVEALDDSDDSVVQSAAFALGELNDHRAIEPLTRVLFQPVRRGQRYRETAATALEKIKHQDVVPKIIDALQQEPNFARYKACQVLRELTGVSFGQDVQSWKRWRDEQFPTE